jgi:hypothetical protein
MTNKQKTAAIRESIKRRIVTDESTCDLADNALKISEMAAGGDCFSGVDDMSFTDAVDTLINDPELTREFEETFNTGTDILRYLLTEGTVNGQLLDLSVQVQRDEKKAAALNDAREMAREMVRRVFTKLDMQSA